MKRLDLEYIFWLYGIRTMNKNRKKEKLISNKIIYSSKNGESIST